MIIQKLTSKNVEIFKKVNERVNALNTVYWNLKQKC
jgi:hypothetical protein